MLYLFTASNKDARKHFHDTIENPYKISQHLGEMDTKVVRVLEDNGLANEVHMWGAVPGDQNIPRWKNLKPGDRILAYSQGAFLYYGTVFTKTHNPSVAEQIWGTDILGRRWEYIYFIKDLKKIEIPRIDFAAFFGYKLNYGPQGFSNVAKEKLEIKLRKYSDIDELILDLNENFMISDEENEEDSFQANLDSNYKDVKTNVDESPEKKGKPTFQNGKEVWGRSAAKAKTAIKKANFTCEVEEGHESFISDSSKKPYMEAHHLIPMKMQNDFVNKLDVVGNIICLCPNCHRKIHLARDSEKKVIISSLYEARVEKLKKYKIEVSLEDLLGYYAIK